MWISSVIVEKMVDSSDLARHYAHQPEEKKYKVSLDIHHVYSGSSALIKLCSFPYYLTVDTVQRPVLIA